MRFDFFQLRRWISSSRHKITKRTSYIAQSFRNFLYLNVTSHILYLLAVHLPYLLIILLFIIVHIDPPCTLKHYAVVHCFEIELHQLRLCDLFSVSIFLPLILTIKVDALHLVALFILILINELKFFVVFIRDSLFCNL